MDFLKLLTAIKRAQCYFISALHHVPFFLDGACLLLVPVKTAVDSQVFQTRCVVVQLAVSRSKEIFVVLTLLAVLPT